MCTSFRSAVLFLVMFCVAAPAAFARSVYLKDGSVIENVRSVWREQGKIQVLVNRDVLLTLAKDEVNLDKTFKTGKATEKRAVHAKAHKAAVVKTVSGQVEEPPVVANAPAQKVAGAAKAAAVNNPAATAQTPAKEVQPATKSSAPANGDKPAPAPTVAAAPQAQPPAQSPEAAKKALQEAAAQAMMQDGGKAMAASATSALLIFGGIVFVMMLIFWKVYMKAGEAGWKSLIPIYNMIVLLRIAGRPAWWLLLFFVPLVNLVFLTIMHIDLAKRFGKETWFGFGLTFASPVFFAILAFDNSIYQEA